MTPPDQMQQEPAMQGQQRGMVAPQGAQELTEDDFETVVAAVSEQIHSEQMIDQVAQMFVGAPPEEHPNIIASLTYKVVTDVMGQIEQGGGPVEYDFLAGVATETIDMLVAIVGSVTQTLPEDDLREQALLKVVAIHGQNVENDPEQQMLAQEQLAEMQQTGQVDEGMAYMQQLQQKYGAA